MLDGSDHQVRRVPSKTWRELMTRIWEVEPLSCPRCGYEMKIISLIHEPNITARILPHLRLWKEPPDPHEEKSKAPADGPVVMEDFDDGWPGYEEPVYVPSPTSPDQRQASGLMGSLTEPSKLRVERSRRCGQASPKRMRPRLAVEGIMKSIAAGSRKPAVERLAGIIESLFPRFIPL